MKFKDYYKVLGVSEDAGTDEIRKQYRRLARKYHPDVSSEPDAEERFKEIGEAYEVLRDRDKRRAYDDVRRGGWQAGQDFRPPPGWDSSRFEFSDVGQSPFGDSGFSDFFESLFGGLGGARPRARGHAFRGRARGPDSRARLEIDLETAYRGGTRRLTVDGPAGPKTLDVRLPKGARDGQTIRLKGQGAPGPSGAGDLLLEIRVRPHPLFQLEGRDVRLDLPVAPWEAALGTTVNVPTLDGEVKLKIPAGTDSGRLLRLRGRGLPGEPPGDELVRVRVVAPRARNDEQKALYRRMAETFDFDPRAGLGG